MKNEFKNKVVWIIGASSGIGAELAIQLNKLGAFVILSARKHKGLLAVQSSLEFPSESMVVEMDLDAV